MDFIEIGHRAVFLGDVTELRNRRDVAVHGIDAFEGDELGDIGIERVELAAEVIGIVVAEYLAGRAAVADAFDHRSMVERVRQDDKAGDLGAERAEGRPVGDIAGGEEKRGFLAVQVCQLLFEEDVVMVGTGDVPCTPGARAAGFENLMHGRKHFWMLAHA